MTLALWENAARDAGNMNLKEHLPGVSITIHSKYFQVSDWLKPHA